MPNAVVSPEVSIAYESFGDPGDPPVLLVMGFGAQLLGWHEDFCRALAGRGRYVIRYDNRDCGLSTKFDDHPVDVGEFMATVSSGDIPPPSRWFPTGWSTWPTTDSACSPSSVSNVPTWSARRWEG